MYTKSGTNLAACVIQESTAIIDHKLYWAPTDSIEEARYLCGILNSEALRSGVAKYQSQGQWGARDFDNMHFCRSHGLTMEIHFIANLPKR